MNQYEIFKGTAIFKVFAISSYSLDNLHIICVTFERQTTNYEFWLPAWNFHFVCHDFVPLSDVIKSVLHHFDTLSITNMFLFAQTDIKHLWNRQAAQTREIGTDKLWKNPWQSQFLFKNQHMYISPYSTIKKILNKHKVQYTFKING